MINEDLKRQVFYFIYTIQYIITKKKKLFIKSKLNKMKLNKTK